MIKIDPDESKVLEFKMDITGNVSEPAARLLVPIGENNSLAITGEIHSGVIQVTIPVLRPLYEQLKPGAARLEVIVDGKIFNTWFDQIEYKNEVKVVTETIAEKEAVSTKPSTKIGVSLIKESDISDTPKSKKRKTFKDDYI